MERRNALKALASLVGVAGIQQVTPIQVQDVQGVELTILKVKGHVSQETAKHLKSTWEEAVKGTSLEHTKALVIDENTDVEFIRKA